MAKLFREANFKSLEVGLQTTNEAVLGTVERRLNLKRFIEGVALKEVRHLFRASGIYGLPGETRASS